MAHFYSPATLHGVTGFNDFTHEVDLMDSALAVPKQYGMPQPACTHDLVYLWMVATDAALEQLQRTIDDGIRPFYLYCPTYENCIQTTFVLCSAWRRGAFASACGRRGSPPSRNRSVLR